MGQQRGPMAIDTEPAVASAAVRPRRPPRIFAIVVVLLAAGFLYGGAGLIAAGGSFYYVLAGLALLASGVLLWRGNRLGSRVYGLLLIATLAWGLIEAGADLWALVPRLDVLSLVGLWFLTPFVRRGLYSPQSPPPLFGSASSKTIAAAVIAVVVAVVIIG